MSQPDLAPDPLNPRPRRDVTPADREGAVSDPYGPQDAGTDEAAGGADSSPFENQPTGERTTDDEHRQSRGTGDSVNG